MSPGGVAGGGGVDGGGVGGGGGGGGGVEGGASTVNENGVSLLRLPTASIAVTVSSWEPTAVDVTVLAVPNVPSSHHS